MYDEYLADRISQILEHKHIEFSARKMFGGIAFMVNDKMTVGVVSEKKTKQPTLMVRVGKDRYEEALSQPHARAMDFTGKPMKGFVFVGPDGFDLEDDLENWVDRALRFNEELG